MRSGDQRQALTPAPLPSGRGVPRACFARAVRSRPAPRALPSDAGLGLRDRLVGIEPVGAVLHRVGERPAGIVRHRPQDGEEAGAARILAGAHPLAGPVRADTEDFELVGQPAKQGGSRPLAALEIGDRRDSGGGVPAFRHGGSPSGQARRIVRPRGCAAGSQGWLDRAGGAPRGAREIRNR